MSYYIHYYDEQAGGGAGIKNVYTGSTFQRGSGIGSFLGGLFRKIVPYLASGAKAVGKEAVRTGLNVLDDVGNKRANFKESLNARVRESGKNLKRKAADKISNIMKGSGYKALASKRKRQSTRTRVAVHNALRKKNKHKRKTNKRSTGKKRKTVRRKKLLRSVSDIFGPK